MGKGKVIFTFEWLIETLHLPKDTMILAVDASAHDIAKGRFSVYFAHPDLPLCLEAAEPPQVVLKYGHEWGKMQFEGWGI